MEPNMDRLAAAKAYMRVDGTDDDAVIAALLDAAEQYLRNAGIVRTDSCSALYDLAMRAMTLHWYDQRGGVITGPIVSEIPTGLRAAINQLKAMSWGEVSFIGSI